MNLLHVRLGQFASKLCSLLFLVTFTANTFPVSSLAQTSDPFANLSRPTESAMLYAAILATPKPSSTLGDIQKVIADNGGRLEGKVGSGKWTVLVIRNMTNPSNNASSLVSDRAIIAKLTSSNLFSLVQQNYSLHINTNRLGGSLVSGYRINRQSTSSSTAISSPPKDPLYPSQVYLKSLNVSPLHSSSTFTRTIGVAIFDTGCNQGDVFIAPSYNAISGRPAYGNDDTTGHGTALATLIGARCNTTDICGVAPNSPIFSIKVANDLGSTSSSTAAILDGINYCANFPGSSGNTMAGSPIKIIVLTTEPVYMPSESPILHQYMKWFHDEKNGLIFQSEGRCFMFGTPLPYLQVVSGIDSTTFQAFSPLLYSPNMNLAFCAPGTELLTHNGREVVRANGSPYAAGLCAGIAALLWANFPMAKSSDIAAYLASDGYRPTPEHSSTQTYFGKCMPNAAGAYAALRGLANQPPSQQPSTAGPPPTQTAAPAPAKTTTAPPPPSPASPVRPVPVPMTTSTPSYRQVTPIYTYSAPAWAPPTKEPVISPTRR